MTLQLNESAQKVYEAITSRLDVVSDEYLKQKLQEGGPISGFWATAPTSRPHFGYLVPFVKMAECVAAGCDINIYVADSYAYLVNYDVSQEIVGYRAQYYSHLIRTILKTLGVDMSKVHVVQESIEYTTTPAFLKDFARMLVASTQEDVKSVGLEVTTTTMMSPLLCPVYQALSEVYIGGEFQLGGTDQLGMYAYADKVLPRVGYNPVSHLANVILPGLKREKMSSSSPAETKIEWLDSTQTVREKFAGISCPDFDSAARNAVLPLFQHGIFPLLALKSRITEPVQVTLVDGSTKQYTVYEDLENDFRDGKVEFDTLRDVITDLSNLILDPIREEYKGNKEWQEAEKAAYGSMSIAV